MSTFIVKDYITSSEVGITSCIGVLTKKYPVSFGNYFFLISGLPIANFWYENLEELKRLGIIKDTVLVREFKYCGKTWGMIIDDRIPKEWYYDNLCFSGVCYPPIEIIRKMFEFHGDEKNYIKRHEKISSQIN